MKGPQSLQPGDIIYLAHGRRTGATGGPHPARVGIVFHDARGWMLAESAGERCRYRPLRGAVAGSSAAWFVVRRLQRRLSGAELGALRAACERRQGRWHQLLRPEITRDFHSRFVEQAYAEAGIDPGAGFSAELLRCPGHAPARPRLRLAARLAWGRRALAAMLRPAPEPGRQGL